ncbi:pyridoxal phosphate-dependent aminotransferase [Fusobacterium sp. PH5-44]|uniref:pyridoxal phosphate-dependent aminotransferase n=1 Tax=unclassified Fusobacterium TaxID=2648384 RepID=UPI003D1AE233
MELNRVVTNLKYSLIRTVAEEAQKYSNVISLTIGEPDIETPRELIMETLEYAKKQHFGYAPTAGSVKSRTLVADFYNKTYNTNFTHENVLFHIGSSEGLISAIRTITNPGDEIIVFAPFYPGYLPMIELSYGVPVIVDISKNDFKITPELIGKHLTAKTKAIIFCSPCNPTGVVMSNDEIKAICNFLKDKNVFIISDEIYSMINFNGFTSFGVFPEILDKLIITNGFSKSHSMTGWRNGYAIVPKDLRQFFINNTLYNVSSPMTLSLVAGDLALEKYADVSKTVSIYKERAEIMRDALTKLGYKVIKPEGAFYLFVDYNNISKKKSMDFVMDMLKQVQVALVPGIAFETEGYVRISLTVDKDKLLEAAQRMSNYKDN